MMTIGLPARREKELAEVASDAWMKCTNGEIRLWSRQPESYKNILRAEVRVVLDEAFLRLQDHREALWNKACHDSAWPARDTVCAFLAHCRQFLASGPASNSANIPPVETQ